MKHLKGKRCKLIINSDNRKLFYTVSEVIDVSDIHITFKDKFNKPFIFRIEDIVEVHDVY